MEQHTQVVVVVDHTKVAQQVVVEQVVVEQVLTKAIQELQQLLTQVVVAVVLVKQVVLVEQVVLV
jgi:hypothetical protein